MTFIFPHFINRLKARGVRADDGVCVFVCAIERECEYMKIFM